MVNKSWLWERLSTTKLGHSRRVCLNGLPAFSLVVARDRNSDTGGRDKEIALPSVGHRDYVKTCLLVWRARVLEDVALPQHLRELLEPEDGGVLVVSQLGSTAVDAYLFELVLGVIEGVRIYGWH